METFIEMSEREISRLEVLKLVVAGMMTQVAAGKRLSLTDRQVRRLLERYSTEGARGLVHRQRGRPSNHRTEERLRKRIMKRVRERYSDFGPTLAVEYLREEGFDISRETLRRWMIQDGLRRAKRGKRTKPHPPRERRAHFGELVQVDGSLHDWFEGRGPSCSLIAFIDDATGQVLYLHFVPHECTQAYLDGLRDLVGQYGCPVAIYSDRHSIFTKHDPEDYAPTQFQRALDSLDIEDIQASTPQAKGRVERLFQTLQDRLVKFLRLHKVKNIKRANELLPGFMKRFNERFSVVPVSAEDKHLPFNGSPEELARICANHETRTLSRNLVLTYRNRRYIIQTGLAARYDLRGAKVTVVQYPDERIELVHGKKLLPFNVFREAKPARKAEDEKSLNRRVDEAARRREAKAASRPKLGHPWRRYQQPPYSPTEDVQIGNG